jgi:hypothetical protein
MVKPGRSRKSTTVWQYVVYTSEWASQEEGAPGFYLHHCKNKKSPNGDHYTCQIKEIAFQANFQFSFLYIGLNHLSCEKQDRALTSASQRGLRSNTRDGDAEDGVQS